jgi:hypothetical protein
MSKQVGCNCCAADPMEPSVVKAPDDSKAKCEISAAKDQAPVDLASAPAIEMPVILTFALVSFESLPFDGLPLKVNLVVPRIRPPNLGNHGLRAPPSRQV